MSVNSKGQSLIHGRVAKWLEGSFFHLKDLGSSKYKYLPCVHQSGSRSAPAHGCSSPFEMTYVNENVSMSYHESLHLLYICVLHQGRRTKWVTTCPRVSIYGFGSFPQEQDNSEKVLDLDSSWFVVETLTNHPNFFSLEAPNVTRRHGRHPAFRISSFTLNHFKSVELLIIHFIVMALFVKPFLKHEVQLLLGTEIMLQQ